jgi:hypothetical protein
MKKMKCTRKARSKNRGCVPFAFAGEEHIHICTQGNKTKVYKNPRATAKFFIVTLGVLHKQEWIPLSASVDFQPSPDNESSFSEMNSDR